MKSTNAAKACNAYSAPEIKVISMGPADCLLVVTSPGGPSEGGSEGTDTEDWG